MGNSMGKMNDATLVITTKESEKKHFKGVFMSYHQGRRKTPISG
jgi:hypothetical protein